MSDVEFFAKLNHKRLTSLDEDHKRDRAEYLQDIKNRELKRTGKLPAPEYSREPLPGCDAPKENLSNLLRSGKLIPASELAKQKEDAQKAADALEEAIRSEGRTAGQRPPQGRIRLWPTSPVSLSWNRVFTSAVS